MLSRRFTAWQIPANQITATSVYAEGSAASTSDPASANTRNAPIASDATSLATGDSCSLSSRMPTTNIASAPKGTGSHSTAGPARSHRRAIAAEPTNVAAAIAMPPIVGVGAVCHRSARGGTTAPPAAANRRTTAPPTRLHAVATMNTANRRTSTNSSISPSSH